MRLKKITKLAEQSNQSIRQWFACNFFGYCPTSKEIDDEEIKKLAKRLEGKSKKETLTNLLEWQDINVFFWGERHPISTILFYAVFVVFPLFFSIGFYCMLIISFFLETWLLPSFLTMFFSGSVASLSTIFIIIFFVLRSKDIQIKEGFCNILKPSISIKMLLGRDRKLGICRDYAKLTACLLLSIYKTADIYFLHSKGHVATGMKIEGDLYVLDQHLPLLRIDQWIKREHGSFDPAKISFLYRNVHKFSNNRLDIEKIDSLLPKTHIKPIQSPEELSRKLIQYLDIPLKELNSSKSGFFSVALPRWKAGADLFEMNDEIVNYSLSHWMKTRISNLLIDLTKVAKIEIEKEGRDLVFKITCMS